MKYIYHQQYGNIASQSLFLAFLMYHNNPHRTECLPLVLLRLGSAFKTILQCTTAELVYGAPPRLSESSKWPTELIPSSAALQIAKGLAYCWQYYMKNHHHSSTRLWRTTSTYFFDGLWNPSFVPRRFFLGRY